MDNSLSSLNEILAQAHVQLDELVVSPHSELVGASIGTVEVQGKGVFLVVALRREDGEMLIHPGLDVFVHVGDTLIVMGRQGDMPQFSRRLIQTRGRLSYRGAKL